MNITKRLMIVGGGSGGHIFSGLVIANYLLTSGWKINWLGTTNKMEAHLIPKYKIKIDFINISGLRNKGIIEQLLSSFRLITAIKEAKNIIQYYKPNIVLGMGGYVSGPGGIAAWLSNIPLIIHEQNAIAGLTNRWLAKIATNILQAFPNTLNNANTVGNPIREEIISLPNPEIRYINRIGPLRILVLGGSQGSRTLNKLLPIIFSKLTRKVFIWHQTGVDIKQITKNSYKKSDNNLISYKIDEFINDIKNAYNWADIVICRSGALTVSEITTVGLAAIFIPFKHKDRQQYLNALPLKKIKAAKIFEESQNLLEILPNILNKISRSNLLEMAKKAKSLSHINAIKNIEKILTKTIDNN